MTPWRRRLRRLRIALTVCLACLIILAAVGVGLLRLLLPQVGLHTERVAAFLSEQLQRPVSIDGVEGYWGERGPQLRLEGVHIAAADPTFPPLVIPEAELGLDVGAWLSSHRRWSEFRINGLDLTAARRADGSWQVSGLTGEGDNPLLLLSAVVLRDTQVRIQDAEHDIDVRLKVGELRLIRQGDRHRVVAVLRRDTPVAGNSLQFVADLDTQRWSGRAYLGGEALDLAALTQGLHWRGRRLDTGRGRLQLWAELQDGAPVAAQAALDWSGLELQPAADAEEGVAAAGLAELKTVARWQRNEGEAWTLQLAGLRAARSGSNPIDSRVDIRHAADGYRVEAEQLDISTLTALAGLLPDQAKGWAPRAGAQGQLRDLRLRYASREDFEAEAELAGVSFQPVDKVPGLSNLGGQLHADPSALLLELPAQAVTLNWPRKFRQPLAFSRLAGRLAAFPLQPGWRLETDALDVEGQGFALQLRGGVELLPDAGKPLLDLYAIVMPGDVPAAKQFWPLGDMSPKAMDWLDRALVAGTLDSGRAAIHADLDDWPIEDFSGQFRARAEISGLTLDYNSAWPRAEGVTATADFINSSLHAQTSGGTVLGAQVRRAVADIPAFKNAVLGLDVEGEGGGPELLAIINASPLGKRYGKELAGLEIGGTAKVNFRLDLPFAPGVPGVVKGQAQLADARIVAKKWDVDFAKATGPLRFSSEGFQAGPLRMEQNGYPAQVSVAIGDDVRDAANAVEVQLDGNLPFNEVFAKAETLKPWWPRFSGRSEWNIALAVPREAAAPTRVNVRSELRGTAIDLPAPLDKPAGDALPVSIEMQLPMEGSPLSVRVADVLRLRGRLPDGQRDFAAQVAFGSSMPAEFPQTGLSVGGRARRLDMSGWAGIGIGAGGDGGHGLLNAVDVRADKALLGGREFSDLGLVLARQPDQVGVSFSGAQLQGTLQVPTADLLKRGITAQFEHLYWPEAPRPADGEGQGEEDDTDPLDGVVPATIPPLHLWIGDFRLGSANLGETRLESLPSGEGMRIEQFETQSADMEMHVRGQWNGDGKKHRSDVDLDLTSENLGRMLTALGFAGLFEGGQTLAHLDAYWNGSPAAFALARLEGKLKLSVSEGRILDVEPGMGRLFGLFSVREIPRRLALDFGDFFRSGMSFTAISGEFTLGSGNAVTSNLHIASPAADIRINGRTGLKARDYDQQMVVTPRVGGALTVVGALAGGPAGAAAGLAVQTLFNKAINQVTTARYHVTGGWDKPDITLISRESARQRPGGQPGAQAEPPAEALPAETPPPDTAPAGDRQRR